MAGWWWGVRQEAGQRGVWQCVSRTQSLARSKKTLLVRASRRDGKMMEVKLICTPGNDRAMISDVLLDLRKGSRQY